MSRTHRTVPLASNDQLRALRSEAGQAGDQKLVQTCTRALAGSQRARKIGSKILAETKARG